MTAIMLSCSVDAQLLDGFVYYGAAVQSQQYDDLQLNNRLTAEGRNLGYRLFSGYQFNRWIGLELGAQQLADGDFVLKQNTDQSVIATSQLSAKAFDAKLILSYSFADDWFVRAQTGLMSWRQQRTDAKLVQPTSHVRSKANGEDALFGAGLGYSISQDYALTFEVEKSEVAGQRVVGFSLNLMTKF